MFRSLFTTFTDGRTLPFCNNLNVCTDECQSSYNTTACKCDKFCYTFNDCCHNVSCNRELSIVPGLQELGIDADQIGCIRPSIQTQMISANLSDPFLSLSSAYEAAEDASYFGVFMIDKCPDDVSEIAIKCHEPNHTDTQSQIPVSESTYGISFKNVYCALCNNIDFEDIVWWKFQAHCGDDVLPLIEDGFRYGISLAQTFEVIDEFCLISFAPPDAVNSQLGSRSCIQNLVDVDSCYSNSPKESIKKCREYNEYVIDKYGRIYRNPHCYICSHSYIRDESALILDCYFGKIPLIEDIYFGSGFVPPVLDTEPPISVPISVLVEFIDKSEVTVKVKEEKITIETVTCDPGMIYNPFDDKCRTLSCSEGFTLIDDHCISHRSKCYVDMQIYIHVTHRNCINHSGRLEQCLKTQYFPPQLSITTASHTCREDIGQDTGDSIFNVKSSDTVGDIEQMFDEIFLTNYSYKTCNITDFAINLYCSSKFPECVDRVSLTNASIESPENDTYVILSQNSKHQFIGGIVSIKYNLSEGATRTNKEITADICESSFSCTLVTLNASLFTNLSNDQLQFNPTGDLFARNEYLYTQDGQIQVCSFFERNGTRNRTEIITFLAYDTAQIILSFIGCIISLVALFITFITFSMFSGLRTRAIKAITHLVIALFTAQFVFLLGAGSTDNTNICKFIAVLLHYLWLCTFTWSIILAYNLNKTFSTNKPMSSNQDRNAPIMKYLLFGWLLPLLVVAPGLVIDLCNCSTIPFQYGHDGVCWIYNQYANLVVFGCPLILCLLINFVLFSNTAWNIHTTKKNTKMVQRKNTKLQNVSNELLIYVKVRISRSIKSATQTMTLSYLVLHTRSD